MDIIDHNGTFCNGNTRMVYVRVQMFGRFLMGEGGCETACSFAILVNKV